MQRIFRTMQKGDPQPVCGDDFFQLGVTVFPHENPDVIPDDAGFVEPLTGGMSVFAGIKKLPERLIPARLSELYPEDFQKASGDDALTVWCMNSEILTDEISAQPLTLRWDLPNKPRHGLIEPGLRLQTEVLLRELCATANLWEINEAPE